MKQIDLCKFNNIHKFNNAHILPLQKLDQSLHNLQHGQKVGHTKNELKVVKQNQVVLNNFVFWWIQMCFHNEGLVVLTQHILDGLTC